jgi:hypothetical protein
MRSLSILMLALMVVLSTTAAAQIIRPKMPPSGGSGSGGSSSKDKDKPKKIADLAADTITAKWKDAKTLEITAVIKNTTPVAYDGSRTAKLICVGKDGKPETLKEQQIPAIEGSKTANFKIEVSDKKYFDKDMKWTLEISAGDATAANDKRGPVLLSPGPQPKG